MTKNTIDIQKEEEEIENFSNSDNLKKLDFLMNKFNIFDCLKLTRNEIRHSNFLAWILNPRETHNFKDAFLKQFLIKIIDTINVKDKFYSVEEVRNFDLSNVEILRENENIDLLITDEKNKFVIVIENKIDSFQHDNQLTRYKNYVNEQCSMSQFKKLYLYLSPQKEKIEEPYKYIDYNILKDVLNNILKNEVLNIDVKIVIENYIEIIERDIMDKDGIRKLCREIYKEHSHAIDTICKYKDLREYMSNLLQEVIEENQEEWTLLESTKYFVRFIPKKSDYECLSFAKEDWVPSEKILIFEIHNEYNFIDIDIVVRKDKEENQSVKRKLLMDTIKEIEEFKDYTEPKKKDCYEHIINEHLVTKDEEYNDLVTKSKEEIKKVLKQKINDTNLVALFNKIAKEFKLKVQNK